jgi:hypothetical protein
MTEYTIKAYPTEYKGRTYRSRLEARWAAFFDLLGWEAEYEPMDFGSWSPDFLIRNFGGSDVLVEVKPITEFSADVGDKMIRGALGPAEDANLLLVGVSPLFAGPHAATLGWHMYAEAEAVGRKPAPAYAYWQAFPHKPAFRADIMVPQHYDPNDDAAFVGLLLGGRDFMLRGTDSFYLAHTKALWARATEAVQWKPSR